MRNPRNTVVVALGTGPGADRVRELFTDIAERDFASKQSTFLAELVREIVMAFKVDTAAEAEKLGLFREAVMGPHICQAVVNAYNAKAKKIRDQYLSGAGIVHTQKAK